MFKKTIFIIFTCSFFSVQPSDFHTRLLQEAQLQERANLIRKVKFLVPADKDTNPENGSFNFSIEDDRRSSELFDSANSRSTSEQDQETIKTLENLTAKLERSSSTYCLDEEKLTEQEEAEVQQEIDRLNSHLPWEHQSPNRALKTHQNILRSLSK